MPLATPPATLPTTWPATDPGAYGLYCPLGGRYWLLFQLLLLP